MMQSLSNGPAARPAVPPISTLALGVVRVTSRLLLTPFFPMTIEGAEAVPGQGPFVLAPKHQRWQDIPLLGLSLTRPLYYLAKAELFASRLGRWSCTVLGGIPLDRRRPLASRRSFALARRVLGAGHGLVVFPEGTYFPQRVGPGQEGAIRWLMSCGAPFIPVGIDYRANGWPCQVTVRYGQACLPGPDEGSAGFVRRLMAQIGRLSGLEGRPS